jgi:hypothetical protein
MFTAYNQQNGSVVKFSSLSQARTWALLNSHVIVKGYAAVKAAKSGVCIRFMRPDGRVGF